MGELASMFFISSCLSWTSLSIKVSISPIIRPTREARRWAAFVVRLSTVRSVETSDAVCFVAVSATSSWKKQRRKCEAFETPREGAAREKNQQQKHTFNPSKASSCKAPDDSAIADSIWASSTTVISGSSSFVTLALNTFCNPSFSCNSLGKTGSIGVACPMAAASDFPWMK